MPSNRGRKLAQQEHGSPPRIANCHLVALFPGDLAGWQAIVLGFLETRRVACSSVGQRAEESAEMVVIQRDPALAVRVPAPIVLYAALSLADLGFSLAAFEAGAREANPLLAWFAQWGLFEFAKLVLTLLVCCVAFRAWPGRGTEAILRMGNLAMTALFVYHLCLLAAWSMGP